MQPNLKMIEQWADALESGEYKQTTGRLKDENGYCCLGVACQIFMPKWLKENESYADMPIDLYEQMGLKYFDNIKYAGDGTNFETLNDEYKLTFYQIARMIRKQYLGKK